MFGLYFLALSLTTCIIYDGFFALLPKASRNVAHIFEVPWGLQGCRDHLKSSLVEGCKALGPRIGLDAAVGNFAVWMRSGNSLHPSLAVCSTIRNISKRHLL